MKHLLASILFTAVVISTTNATNNTTITIENIVAYGDDDAEIMGVTGCFARASEALDIGYQDGGKTRTVILTFRNIPKYDNMSLTHAHIELQTVSPATADITASIHYQSKMINPIGCEIPNPIPVQSTTNVLWKIPVTQRYEILKTPNINHLLNENFKSEVWNQNKQVTLIISPITFIPPQTGPDGRNFYASFERFTQDSGYKAPKLVMRFSGLSSSPMKQCWTNIDLKGYVIINHVSTVKEVTSVIQCCRLCSEMGDSCQSYTLRQPSSTGGASRMFSCQINNITKELSDRDHCFANKGHEYQHYHVAV